MSYFKKHPRNRVSSANYTNGPGANSSSYASLFTSSANYIKLFLKGAAGVSRATILAMSGLVAFLFDDTEGSGDDYTGDAKGDERRTIQPGRCYDFDGVDDYIDFGNIFDNDGTQSMSWTLWFKTSSTTSNERFISKGDSSGTPDGYAIGHSAGAIRFVMRAGNSTSNNINLTSVASSYNDGDWHFLCVTYDGSKSASGVTIRVDGLGLVMTGSDNLTGNPSVPDAFAISLKHGGGAVFDGLIRDVCCFNSELSAMNCTYLYTYGASGTSVAPDLLVKCEESAGTTAYDSSGNATHGTITNATLSTFHATDTGVIKSYANDVGYSDGGSGVIVPRDESDTANDVTGSALDFSGRVKYDFSYVKSNCLTFDGTNDYVDISGVLPSTDLMVTDGVSVSCWAKRTGNAGSANMIFSHRDQSTQLIQLALHSTNGTTVQFRSSAGTLYSIQYTGATDTDWNHYVAVFDFVGDELRLYLNGVEVDQVAIVSTGSLDSAITYTGAFTSGGAPSGYMHGCLSGLLVSNSALTDLEITTLYAGTLPSTSYDGFYPLAEGSGSTAYDVSGNDNHGTLTNFTLSNAWGTTQDVYHYNILNGFTQYIRFDGVNDYAQTTTQLYSETLDFEIKLKFKAVSTTNPVALFSTIGAGDGRMRLAISTSTGLLNLFIGHTSGNASGTAATGGVYDGDVHEICMKRVGSTMSVDIDNSQVISFTYTHEIDSSSGFRLGALYGTTPSSFFLDGAMKDVMIYDENSTLVFHVPCNESKGSTLTDIVGGNDLTVINSTEADFWAETVPAVSSTLDATGESLSNPSGEFHNGAETKLNAPECPALRVADDAKTTSRLFSGASPVDIGYGDFEEDFDSEGFYFSDTSTNREYKNLLIFDEEKVSSDLTDIQTFLNH